jgi:hypothetical protein
MSVLYWSPSSGLSLVKSVTTINEDSWVDGWGVETQEIGA